MAGETETDNAVTESTSTVAGGGEAAVETADTTEKTSTVAGSETKADAKADTKSDTKAADTATDKKPDAKADAAKAAELEVKFPDGWATDNDLVAEFKPLAKELGLDSAKSQKLVDLFVKGTVKAGEARQAENEKTLAGWLTEAKADKDIGGAKWDATVANVQRVVRQYGDAPLRQLFDDTGLGDHPAVLRFLNKLGAGMAEDKFGGGNKQSAAGSEPTLADVLYTHPTSKPAARG